MMKKLTLCVGKKVGYTRNTNWFTIMLLVGRGKKLSEKLILGLCNIIFFFHTAFEVFHFFISNNHLRSFGFHRYRWSVHLLVPDSYFQYRQRSDRRLRRCPHLAACKHHRFYHLQHFPFPLSLFLLLLFRFIPLLRLYLFTSVWISQLRPTKISLEEDDGGEEGELKCWCIIGLIDGHFQASL